MVLQLLMITVIFVGVIHFLFGMADETYNGLGIRQYGPQANAHKIETAHNVKMFKTTGTDMKAFDIVTRYGESNKDIDKASAGEPAIGIILYPVAGQLTDSDLETYVNGDTTFAAGVWVWVYLFGDDLPFFLTHQAISETLYEGDEVKVGDEAGKFVKAFVTAMESYQDFIDGNVSAATGVMQFVMPDAGLIQEVRITAETTGDDTGTVGVTVDVNIDGTTIFTTQSNRPAVLDTDPDGTVDVQRTIEAGTFSRNSVITVDIDEVADTTPPTGLTVEIVTNFGTIIGKVAENYGATSAADDQKVMVRC